MASTTVRIPEEVYGRVRVIAGVTGTTPGDLLSAAFAEYFENHRTEIAREFEGAKKMLFAGDVDSILEATRPARARRAASASRRTRSGNEVKDRP